MCVVSNRQTRPPVGARTGIAEEEKEEGEKGEEGEEKEEEEEDDAAEDGVGAAAAIAAATLAVDAVANPAAAGDSNPNVAAVGVEGMAIGVCVSVAALRLLAKSPSFSRNAAPLMYDCMLDVLACALTLSCSTQPTNVSS